MADKAFQSFFGMAQFGGVMFSEVGDDLTPIAVSSVPVPEYTGRDFYLEPQSFDDTGQFIGGDYVLDSVGQFQLVDNITNAIFLSLMCDAKNYENPNDKQNIGWWVDPESGSLLYLLKRTKATMDKPRKAELYILTALKPLVSKGLIKKFTTNPLDVNGYVTAFYNSQTQPDFKVTRRLTIGIRIFDISKNTYRNFVNWPNVG